MSNRRSFRPGLGDRLEERVVLSRVGVIQAVGVGSVHVLGATGGASLGPVGALGDSYTDEYRDYFGDARVHARNWVEILSATRGVNFGPYSQRSRGAPRNSGFAFDWAQGGATSADMVNSQLPGLAAQVAKGQVKTAWIFVGGNDFLYAFSGIITGQVSQTAAVPTLQQTEATLENNFKSAVNTLLAASPSVHLVVSTLPDIGFLPIARQAEAASPLVAPLLGVTTQLIQKYNAALVQDAQGNPRIAVVDLATTTQQFATTPGQVPFGGQTIDLTTPGNDYHHFFLADSIHVGTVAQGLIADAFISAVDTHFSQHVQPLSPTEIIRFAQKVQSPAGRSIR
jgi:phospholipase/lecithinase/hemolysin